MMYIDENIVFLKSAERAMVITISPADVLKGNDELTQSTYSILNSIADAADTILDLLLQYMLSQAPMLGFGKNWAGESMLKFRRQIDKIVGRHWVKGNLSNMGQ